MQINPETGIHRHQLVDLLMMVDDDTYEIVSFDADNTICYFVFAYQYFDDRIDGENFIRFKEKFINIANDTNLEYSNHLYNFDGEIIYFGY